MFKSSIMHLSAAIPGGGGGGGGVTPGTYAGMGRDLLTLVTNFKPGMGELDCFGTLVAGSPGKDPRDFCSPAAILELETSVVPVCERTGYVSEHVHISLVNLPLLLNSTRFYSTGGTENLQERLLMSKPTAN